MYFFNYFYLQHVNFVTTPPRKIKNTYMFYILFPLGAYWYRHFWKKNQANNPVFFPYILTDNSISRNIESQKEVSTDSKIKGKINFTQERGIERAAERSTETTPEIKQIFRNLRGVKLRLSHTESNKDATCYGIKEQLSCWSKPCHLPLSKPYSNCSTYSPSNAYKLISDKEQCSQTQFNSITRK